MKENARKYLEHLDEIFRVEPRFQRYSEPGISPPLHTITYEDIPEKGMITGLTSGVSFVEQPDGRELRPELIISVDSSDTNWIAAMADIAYQHRGEFSFNAGDTISFNAKISEESDMTCFFVWYQDVIAASHERICLPDWHIEIVQLFPVHDDERLFIREFGPQAFIELGPDPCDVTRASVAHRHRP